MVVLSAFAILFHSPAITVAEFWMFDSESVKGSHVSMDMNARTWCFGSIVLSGRLLHWEVVARK